MSGFLGIFNNTRLSEQELHDLGEMSHAIRHRGADESRAEISESFALALRYAQANEKTNYKEEFSPICDKYVAVFDGEIYNYSLLKASLIKEGMSFESESKIETLVKMYDKYGVDFLKQLNGMFTICIYDKEENSLFLARDAFGIKPLYYHKNDDSLTFSSEFKAFLFDSSMKQGYGVDSKNLQHYFTFQYVPEPDTISPELKVLPAGHYVIINESLSVSPVKFAQLSLRPDPSISFDEKEKLLRKAIEESVESHMNTDRTLGSFLSSGIDSAVITTLASKLQPGIKAFTVAFDAKAYSEIDDAAKIAEKIDVEHIKLVADVEDFMAAHEKVIYHLDGPVADPSTMAIYLICQEATKHVDAVLSGEGSDELFAGYKVYQDSLIVSKIFALPSLLKKMLGLLYKMIPEGVKGKNLIYRGITPVEERFVGNAFIFTEEEKKAFYKLYDPSIHFSQKTEEIYAEVQKQDMLTKMQHCDLNTWMKGDILVKGDRLSTAHNLQVRMPLLDKAVVDVAQSLARNDKLSNGTTKFIFRHAFSDIVDEVTMMRPKLGYPVPVRLWLRNELYDWAKNIILSPYADEYINKDAALKMLEDHRLEKRDNYRTLWTILTFITWYRLYIGEADKTKQKIINEEL